MANLFLFVFFVIILSCYGFQSFAQTSLCEKSLKPDGGSYGYKLRENPARCEGMYTSRISAHRLEFISLTKDPLQYDLNAEKFITVKPAGKGIKSSMIIHMHAKATSYRTYYQMDTRLFPGQSFKWPVLDVLRPQNLTADRLGITVWYEPDGVKIKEKIFIPV